MSGLLSRVGIGRQLGLARRADALPLSREQLFLGTQSGRDAPVLGTSILTFTVDRHRRSDDQPFRSRRSRNKTLEKGCRRIRVGVDVPPDLVHRLADANRSRQVDDSLDILRASSAATRSPTSPWMKDTPLGNRGSLPRCTWASRLSRTTTSSPRPTRCLTRCDPMNPAPPVTSIRLLTVTVFQRPRQIRTGRNARLPSLAGWKCDTR